MIKMAFKKWLNTLDMSARFSPLFKVLLLAPPSGKLKRNVLIGISSLLSFCELQSHLMSYSLSYELTSILWVTIDLVTYPQQLNYDQSCELPSISELPSILWVTCQFSRISIGSQFQKSLLFWIFHQEEDR